jgi:bd-type cytochrome oxidase subunit I
MQHPVAYRILPDHRIELTSLSGLLNNPWAIVEYFHVMAGTVITGRFLMACLSSYYLLLGAGGQSIGAECCGKAAAICTRFSLQVYRFTLCSPARCSEFTPMFCQAASPGSLQAALCWWIPGVLLVACYFAFILLEDAAKVFNCRR